MRWNTDKYNIDIFACDTANCNKDLGAGDCAHVCTTKEQQQKHQSPNARPVFILIEYRIGSRLRGISAWPCLDAS